MPAERTVFRWAVLGLTAAVLLAAGWLTRNREVECGSGSISSYTAAYLDYICEYENRWNGHRFVYNYSTGERVEFFIGDTALQRRAEQERIAAEQRASEQRAVDMCFDLPPADTLQARLVAQHQSSSYCDAARSNNPFRAQLRAILGDSANAR